MAIGAGAIYIHMNYVYKLSFYLLVTSWKLVFYTLAKMNTYLK